MTTTTTTVYFQSDTLPGWWSIDAPAEMVADHTTKLNNARQLKQQYNDLYTRNDDKPRDWELLDKVSQAYIEAQDAAAKLRLWIEEETGTPSKSNGETLDCWEWLSTVHLLRPDQEKPDPCHRWEDRDVAHFRYKNAGELAEILNCRPDWPIGIYVLPRAGVNMDFKKCWWRVGLCSA